MEPMLREYYDEIDRINNAFYRRVQDGILHYIKKNKPEKERVEFIGFSLCGAESWNADCYSIKSKYYIHSENLLPTHVVMGEDGVLILTQKIAKRNIPYKLNKIDIVDLINWYSKTFLEPIED